MICEQLLQKVPFYFFGFQSGLQYIHYFIAGYIFEKAIRSSILITWPRGKQIGWAIIIAVGGLTITIYQFGIGRGTLPETLMAWCGIVVVLSIAYLVGMFVDKDNKASPNEWRLAGIFGTDWGVHYLSKMSMYVYLFHDPMNFMILRYGTTIATTGWDIVMYQLMRTLGVIVVSLLIGICIEKIKKTSLIKFLA